MKVSGEYTYYTPDNVTLEQAKQIALDRAKIQLIADEFGTYVGNTNITQVKNVNGTSDVRTMSLGESEVKGEWIETIGETKYDIGYENDMLYVKVRISGRIREIIYASIDYKARILKNGTENKFESTEFRANDAMYLSFQSPVDGYLTVYLYDGSENVYCLLPYRTQSVGQIPIKADEKYVFFDPSKSFDINPDLVDQYVLTCAGEMELNRIYVIFSPNIFTKASSNLGVNEITPKMLTFKDFHRWLSKCRKQDSSMSLNVIDLVIRP